MGKTPPILPKNPKTVVKKTVPKPKPAASQGAPKGNQFWMMRATHGRPKKFKTPNDLWIAACEYFKWCEANPLIEVDFKGKDADRVEIPKMRAFTWQGLELFIDIDRLRDYKTNPEYKGFSPIVTRIEKIIYEQKFTGAAAGFLNPNIIARDLGLVDKTDNAIKIAPMDIDYSKLSDSALKEIAEATTTKPQ